MVKTVFNAVLFAFPLFLILTGSLIAAPDTGDLTTTRIKSYLKQADAFYLDNFDSTMYYGIKALKLSQKLNDEELLAKTELQLGYALIFHGDLDSADNYLYKAHAHYKTTGDELNLARTNNALGLANFHRARYTEAMDLFLNALETFERNNDMDGLGAVYINLSGIYEILGEYEVDLNYSRKAAKVYKTLGNDKQYALCLNNIGHTYNNIGQYNMAIKYLKKSIEIKEKLGALSSIAYSYVTLYESYQHKHASRDGKKYLDISFDIFTKTGNIEGQIEVNRMLAQYYAENGRYEQAIDNALISYMLAKQSGMRKAEMDLCNELATYYVANSQMDKASDFERRYLKMKDSLLSKAISNEVINAQVTYELNKKRFSLKEVSARRGPEMTHLERSNAMIHYISIVVITLLAAVQIIAMFYYWTRRKKAKVNS